MLGIVVNSKPINAHFKNGDELSERIIFGITHLNTTQDGSLNAKISQ